MAITIQIPAKMGKQIQLLAMLRNNPDIRGVNTWIVDRMRRYYKSFVPDLGTIMKKRANGPHTTKVHLFIKKSLTNKNRDYEQLERWVKETAPAFGLSYSEFVRRFCQYWIDRATTEHRDGGLL